VVQPAPATRRGRAHRPHHDPHAGKPHGEELAGIHSARLGREWRVLYEIDDTKHVVVVLDIRPRSNAYRLR
jgi:mRNA-degrading endonuclease RelE of RelBE toxin-antitoxin system